MCMWCEARSAQIKQQVSPRNGEVDADHDASPLEDRQDHERKTPDITSAERAAIPPSGQRTLDGLFANDTLNSKQEA